MWEALVLPAPSKERCKGWNSFTVPRFARLRHFRSPCVGKEFQGDVYGSGQTLGRCHAHRSGTDAVWGITPKLAGVGGLRCSFCWDRFGVASPVHRQTGSVTTLVAACEADHVRERTCIETMVTPSRYVRHNAGRQGGGSRDQPLDDTERLVCARADAGESNQRRPGSKQF